jgi:hypothetical protein
VVPLGARCARYVRIGKARVVANIDRVLAMTEGLLRAEGADYDADITAPGGWWDPLRGMVEGGVKAAGRASEGSER